MCKGKCDKNSPCNTVGTKYIKNLNKILDIRSEIVLLRLKSYIEAERYIELAAKKHSFWRLPFRMYYSRKAKECKENMQYFNTQIDRHISKLRRLENGEGKS